MMNMYEGGFVGSWVGTIVGAIMMLSKMSLNGLHIYIIAVLITATVYAEDFESLALTMIVAMIFVIPSSVILGLFWTNKSRSLLS